MIFLRSYQRELLRILEDPGSPRFGVVTSVPGSGIRQAIEIYLRDVAATSLVLVLSPTRLIVNQWAARLSAHEEISVTVLNSASVALSFLEGARGRRSGVLVATYARTRHGPSSRALSELDFGLIVHDAPLRSFSTELAQLNARARRVIAVVERSQRDSWSTWPVLWDSTSEDLIRGGRLSAVSVYYDPTVEERSLRDEAIGLLQEDASRKDMPLVLPSNSMPELHARLLTLASIPGQNEEFSDRAWAVLDRMEGWLATDSRLATLERVLSQRMSAGDRCIILTPTHTDARYIAHHLASTAEAPRAVLSAATTIADRRGAFEELASGECIVATHSVLESADSWPTGSTAILWPSPTNQRVMEELSLTAVGTSGITVLELRERNRLNTTAS